MEKVILVNELNEATGEMEKMEVHLKGLLHRAFSIFIFNKNGEMLLQQRSFKKYHSAGLWSNACCGHPRPGEAIDDAAHRRLFEELGFKTTLKESFNFIYKTTFDNGLTEYEFDHVFTGFYNGEVLPEETEVNDFCFRPIREINSSLQSHPAQYTEWFSIAFQKLIQEEKELLL